MQPEEMIPLLKALAALQGTLLQSPGPTWWLTTVTSAPWDSQTCSCMHSHTT